MAAGTDALHSPTLHERVPGAPATLRTPTLAMALSATHALRSWLFSSVTPATWPTSRSSSARSSCSWWPVTAATGDYPAAPKGQATPTRRNRK